ncbi:MAG: hypothetical protein WED87_04135, partial [Dehalococcoidia bacterium]
TSPPNARWYSRSMSVGVISSPAPGVAALAAEDARLRRYQGRGRAVGAACPHPRPLSRLRGRGEPIVAEVGILGRGTIACSLMLALGLVAIPAYPHLL